MAIFADRVDAGEQLSDALTTWARTDAVVLGIPRGGVVVAAVVARRLQLPLDVAVVRKLGAPDREEYAVGAIAEGVRIVHDDVLRDGNVSDEQLASVEARERIELDRRSRAFGAAPLDLTDRTVLIVDDGVATGATMNAACRSAKARGAARVVVAVPVAPRTWRPDAAADEFVCPHRESEFWAVGPFYDDFTQTSDDEVIRLLRDDPSGMVSD